MMKVGPWAYTQQQEYKRMRHCQGDAVLTAAIRVSRSIMRCPLSGSIVAAGSRLYMVSELQPYADLPTRCLEGFEMDGKLEYIEVKT
jgi:hypothetical protein